MNDHIDLTKNVSGIKITLASSKVTKPFKVNDRQAYIYLSFNHSRTFFRIHFHSQPYSLYSEKRLEDLLQLNHLSDSVVSISSTPFKDLLTHVMTQQKSIPQRILDSYADIILHYIQREILFNTGSKSNKNSKETTMKNIRTYIDQNIKNNISAKNLSNIFYMSERSLYYLFQEFESKSPLAYIQQQKVAHAYQEISSKASHRSITQIAIDYGFSNLGRFAQLYRMQVGELPSTTRTNFQ